MSIFSQESRKTIRGQAILSGLIFCVLIVFLGGAGTIGNWRLSSLSGTQADVAVRNINVVAPLAEAGESQRDRSVRVPWEREELANRKD